MRKPIGIFLLAFAARLLLFLIILNSHEGTEGFLLFDSGGYMRLSENTINEGVFSQTENGQTLIADGIRTPLYPSFLALFHPVSLHVEFVVVIQCLLGALTVLFVFLSAEKLGITGKFLWLSVLLAALDVPSVFYNNLIMTETLFTLFLSAAIYAYIRSMQSKAVLDFIVFSFMLALCFYTRPSAIYLPVFLFSVLCFYKQLNLNKVLIGMGIWLLCMSPWLYRNYRNFDTLFFSNIGLVNLYFHTKGSIDAELQYIPIDQAQHKLMNHINNDFQWEGNEKDVKKFRAVCKEEALTTIKEQPLVFVKQTVKSFVWFFVKPVRGIIEHQLGLAQQRFNPIADRSSKQNVKDVFSRVTQEQHIIVIVLIALQIIVNLFIVVSLFYFFFRFRLQHPFSLFALTVIVFFSTTSALTETDGRFKIALIPLFALIAGLAWTRKTPLPDANNQ